MLLGRDALREATGAGRGAVCTEARNHAASGRRTGNSSIVALLGLLVLAGCLVCATSAQGGSVAGSAAKASVRLTLYSVAAREQFVDNSDDEARGDVNNPFGPHLNKPTKRAGIGPFPGDESLFTFNLYTGSDLKTKAGTAFFVCQYYFSKSAFCHASYQLDGGALIVAGSIDFEAKSFALAVTGGDGKYSNVTGDVRASPSKNRSQELTFAVD